MTPPLNDAMIRRDVPPRIVVPMAADEATRFWGKVDTTGDCWLWTAAKDPLGYGRFQRSGGLGTCLAHRLAYELLVGPIPEGLVIDHLCRVPSCVRPEHLEPVTQGTNVERGEWDLAERNRAKEVCPQNHPYDEANTYINPRGSRECRTCRRAAQARFHTKGQSQ